MKSLLAIVSIPVFLILAASSAIAQSSDAFHEIDMVPLAQPAAGKPVNYIIGQDSQSYTAERHIRPFLMNKYETTYGLWYRIRIEAEKAGYVFANPGQEGSAGRRGQTPTDAGSTQPVTMISWHDAIIWCNALSEIEGRTPCYTFNGSVLRDSTDTSACDLAVCDWDAGGYRLPSEAEWEYAARITNRGMQRSDTASGSNGTAATDDAEEDYTDVAWYDQNTNTTHTVGTAGTLFTPDATPSAGSGKANGAGIFDMSGNVLEFCWDWFADYLPETKGKRYTGPAYGSQRVCRGGSWSPYSNFVCAGDRYSFDPNEYYNYLGFRICSGE